MLSFRADETSAAEATAWATRLEIDRSELLRDARRRRRRLLLLRLTSERDAEIWEAVPLDAGESSLAGIADWGPAEDWAEWSHAAG